MHTQTTRVVENELEMLIRVELLVVAILIKVFVGLASEVRDFKKQRTPPGQHICRVALTLCYVVCLGAGEIVTLNKSFFFSFGYTFLLTHLCMHTFSTAISFICWFGEL